MNKRTSKAKASVDKQRRGYKAALKGKDFEKKVGEFLSRRGYKISFEKPVGKDKFDVFGKRYDEYDNAEYCIAECKDKSRVTATDLHHFMGKLRRFYDRLPVPEFGETLEVQGLFAYTGELPGDARDVVKGFKPSIKFKQF
jgi:hypothetical protein